MKHGIVTECLNVNNVRDDLEKLRKQIQIVALDKYEKVKTDADWLMVQRSDFMYWETELRRLVSFFV